LSHVPIPCVLKGSMEWLKDLIAVGACKFKPIVPRPNRNSEFHFLRHVGFAWQRGIAIPYPTLVSELQQERTYDLSTAQRSNPANVHRSSSFDRLSRPPRAYHAGNYAMNRSHTSSTATCPSATQSMPSSTGQGGAPNTGAI